MLQPWPDEHPFALCLTHDVDKIDKRWWHCLYYFMTTRNPYQLKSLITKRKERPYWNFERILEIERKHEVKSTFFFLNESKRPNILRPSSYKLSLGYYDIHDPRVVELIKQLHKDGWEIGVHGSFDSYRNKAMLAKEKEELENIIGCPICGIRQHYLNLDIPVTWRLQREAGFRYDASFGFRDKVGFRDDRLLPFRPFDDDFLVIPLAIMDGPLFLTSKNIGHAWERCKQLIDYVEKNNGLLTILWHNNRFNEKEYSGQSEVYERILVECKRRGAWIAPCRDIYSWCANHDH